MKITFFAVACAFFGPGSAGVLGDVKAPVAPERPRVPRGEVNAPEVPSVPRLDEEPKQPLAPRAPNYPYSGFDFGDFPSSPPIPMMPEEIVRGLRDGPQVPEEIDEGFDSSNYAQAEPVQATIEYDRDVCGSGCSSSPQAEEDSFDIAPIHVPQVAAVQSPSRPVPVKLAPFEPVAVKPILVETNDAHDCDDDLFDAPITAPVRPVALPTLTVPRVVATTDCSLDDDSFIGIPEVTRVATTDCSLDDDLFLGVPEVTRVASTDYSLDDDLFIGVPKVTQVTPIVLEEAAAGSGSGKTPNAQVYICMC